MVGLCTTFNAGSSVRLQTGYKKVMLVTKYRKLCSFPFTKLRLYIPIRNISDSSDIPNVSAFTALFRNDWTV